MYDTIDKQELDTFVSDMTAKGLSAVSISPKTLLGLFNDNASTQLIQNSPLWADYTDKEANTISYPLVDQGLIDAFVASQETTKQRII